LQGVWRERRGSRRPERIEIRAAGGRLTSLIEKGVIRRERVRQGILTYFRSAGRRAL
jgi:hypothetical protein